MISLFVFTLSVFATTFIVGQSKISLPFRARLDRPGVRSWILALLECNACLATWLGAGAYLLHLTPPALTSWWLAALYCCASSLILAKWSGLSD